MLRVGFVKGKGRAVFACRSFRKGEVVEVAPVLVVPARQTEAILEFEIIYEHYYSGWGHDGNEGAIALGYASLYNHAYHPNLRFEYKVKEETIEFTALRDISADEELTINYNEDQSDYETYVGFDTID